MAQPLMNMQTMQAALIQWVRRTGQGCSFFCLTCFPLQTIHVAERCQTAAPQPFSGDYIGGWKQSLPTAMPRAVLPSAAGNTTIFVPLISSSALPGST